MQLLDHLLDLKEKTLFTVGTFDGLHQGHQKLIHEMLLLKKKTNQKTVLLTFNNHPLSVLKPDLVPPLRILTLDQRIYLLEKLGIDITLLVAFTKDIASMTYDVFLNHMHNHLHFTHFFRGENDPLGKDLTGTKDKVQKFADQKGFKAVFVSKLDDEKGAISSSRIRKYLAEGNLQEVSRLLNRPYSIYLKNLNPQWFEDKTARLILKLPGICLPKEGEYPTLFCQEEKSICLTRIEKNSLLVQLSKDIKLQFNKPFELIFKD